MVRAFVLVSLAAAGCSANDDIHAPLIASVTPAHAAPGTSVTIDGNYFCAQPVPSDPEQIDPLACANVGSVTFDAQPASAGLYTDTRVMVDVPSLPPGGHDIVLAVAGRRSNAISFVVE